MCSAQLIIKWNRLKLEAVTANSNEFIRNEHVLLKNQNWTFMFNYETKRTFLRKKIIIIIILNLEIWRFNWKQWNAIFKHKVHSFTHHGFYRVFVGKLHTRISVLNGIVDLKLIEPHIHKNEVMKRTIQWIGEKQRSKLFFFLKKKKRDFIFNFS